MPKIDMAQLRHAHHPLLVAVEAGDIAVVKMLLQAGVDPNDQAPSGDSALQYAVGRGHVAVAQVLLKAGATHSKAKPTLLHVAAANGQMESFRFRIAAGDDHNARDPNGWTPLHGAIWFGKSVSVVAALLALGVDVEARNVNGLSPLAMTAMTGNARIAKMLIESGADPLATGFTGNSALHLAAAHGFPAVIHVLIEAGADPDAKDDGGDTAADCLGLGEDVNKKVVEKKMADAAARSLLRAPTYRACSWLWCLTEVGSCVWSAHLRVGLPLVRLRCTGTSETRKLQKEKQWRPFVAMCRCDT